MSYDSYSCIGGEGWYWERCSSNFIVNVTRNIFSETPPVGAPFREDIPIMLGDIQGIQLSGNKRKDYFANIQNFALRSAAGTIQPRNDFKFESATFQELSYLVHVSSSFEELFIRRNAVIMFMHRILRSAQVNGASLKPAYPGSSTFCTCGKVPHLEFCPMHDVNDDEKEFLFPPLRVGDRVIRGPDWQWGAQGNNEEGTVVQIKEWKGQVNCGVSVMWDNGEKNMYRYGADSCYDVIDAYPMRRSDYRPLYGLVDSAETYWSRYVNHYIKNGISKSKGFFAPHLSSKDLIKMLPDYDIEGRRDMAIEQEAFKVINQVIEIAEKDILEYLGNDRASNSCFRPSVRSQKAINDILFPFQIYLFSQAEGDVEGQRCETAILQGYLSSLCSSCVRILTKAFHVICEPKCVVDVMGALRETALGHLVGFAVNSLYVHTYAMDVISYISGDLLEILHMWCKVMKFCNIENDLHLKKDNLMFLPVYDPSFTPTPQPTSWYLTLFNLLTAISSKIHYNTRYFFIDDKTTELQHLAESYLCSGGLMSVVDREKQTFIKQVYENNENQFDLLHSFFDNRFSEPAWKRRNQPIIVDLELRIFAVFVYLNRDEEVLQRLFNSLMNDEDLSIPPSLETAWKNVMSIREMLRSKKQEYSSHQSLSVNRTNTTNTHFLVRRNSSAMYDGAMVGSTRQQKVKEYTLRIRNSVTSNDLSSGSSIINKGNRRLMTFEGSSDVTLSPSILSEVQQFTEPEFVQPPEHYDDFVDVLMKKLDFLMELNQPLDINRMEGLRTDFCGSIPVDMETETIPLKEERNNVPLSTRELINVSIKKYLTLFIPVSINDVRYTLDGRTENARTLARTLDEAVLMLKTIEDFPQASRLFLLGLTNSLINFKGHKPEEGFSRDYFHHTEGCTHEAYLVLINSWTKLAEYLKELFSKSIRNLNWRLGCSILFLIITMSSTKLPYFSLSVGLNSFIEQSLESLSTWFAALCQSSSDILVTPGPLWDSLAKKTIPLQSPHFHAILEEFQNRGSYLSSKSEVEGIFPISLIMLANCLRICYVLLLLDAAVDHRVKSIHSSAMNPESFHFWTLGDYSNLFVRSSPQYYRIVNKMFDQFFLFLSHEQSAFQILCKNWHPFAHSLYSQVNTSINPSACIRHTDENRIVQGSIENDLIISAGEALLSSYMALLVFISKTKISSQLPFLSYGQMLWKMMYFSPRIQKLTLMLFQHIFVVTDFVPAIPIHQCPNWSESLKECLGDKDIQGDSLKDRDVLGESLHNKDTQNAFVYHLLHLCSHADSCIGAVVGERASCSLCCPYDTVFYKVFSCTNMSFALTLLSTIQSSTYNPPCSMHIRPDGHGASYSMEVTAEEAVYTLRKMLQNEFWRETIEHCVKQILSMSVNYFEKEKSLGNPGTSYEEYLHQRSVFVAGITAVLKVFGGLTPRLYPGCRIRLQELPLRDHSNGNVLLHQLFSSPGSAYAIKCDRTSNEALILMDRIETPVSVSIYSIDVVDRIYCKRLADSLYESMVGYYSRLLQIISIPKELTIPPSPDMPFFNTYPLSLSADLLQNTVLLTYLVHSLHSLVVTSPSLVLSLSQEVVHSLFHMAVKPLPLNSVLPTSIMKQYFNWFIEYLINTYPGSPRFLPMELQSESYEPDHPRHRSNKSLYGLEKDKREDNWNDGKPSILRNEKRMMLAKTIASITGYDENTCYKVFRAFQDNMDATVNYIMEGKKSFIQSLSSDVSEVRPIGIELNDESVLIDLETSIRKPLVSTQKQQVSITKSLLSTVIPPFSRLQHVDAVHIDGIVQSSSLYGVISCICDDDVVYGPVSPTGVITAMSYGKVRLSILNTESGLVEDTMWNEKQVAVQKYRLLFHLDDVQHLRGIVGRVSEVLFQQYTRELIISLLYLMQNEKDVIDTWKINSYDIVRITKFTYLGSTHPLFSSPDVSTITTCLFKLLQLTIMNIIESSYRSLTLIQAFMDGTWDDTENNKVTLYVPDDEDRTQIVGSLNTMNVSSISIGREKDNSVYIASLHPSFPKTKYVDKVTIPGAAGLRILFDPRCYLDPSGASLTFFQDEAMTQVIARFTGTSDLFCPFTVRGNTVRFMYESNLNTSQQWGYGFLVQPFENVNWNNDSDVLTDRCFDWNCFAYDLLIDISRNYDYKEEEFFNRTFNNMITYLKTSGMPFKARVVELLLRIIHSRNIHITTHPDVRGMLNATINYCSHIEENTIVPSQIPLLLDFLLTYTMQDLIVQVSIPDNVPDVPDTPDTPTTMDTMDTMSPPVPPFEVCMPIMEDTLLNRLQTVYILVRCLFFRSLIPPKILVAIMQLIGWEWNEANYQKAVRVTRLFKRSLDDELLQCCTEYALKNKVSLLELSVSDFTLKEDDRARFYSLCEVDEESIQFRLATIQFFNSKLKHCIHLIELLSVTKDNTRKSVGAMITALSNYIIPDIKEGVLNISIQQTEYCGQNAYPVVELDNRRVFTEIERDSDEFEAGDRSAVTSQCMFAQLYRQMQNIDIDVLRAKLDTKDRLMAIKYKGEQGLDWGGLYRDTIERCVEDLFSDRIDLFIPSPNAANDKDSKEEKLIPNPRYCNSKEALAMYRFVGNLIGISLRTKHLLPFELCPQIWKTIVSDMITEEDIEMVDEGFVTTLKQIREYKEQEPDDFLYVFELVFAILDSAGNEIELIPSGNQISVNYQNRTKFCDLALEARINEARAAAEAIADGVYALVPKRALSLFTWEQLELAVKGAPEIPVDILRKHTVYTGWTENHPVVQRFWRVMNELTDKDRSHFLRFTWGRSKLPKTENWSRPFKLAYNKAGDNMLPTAHTCFFLLELPQYTSDAIMRERLLVAFHYGSSGEFIIRYNPMGNALDKPAKRKEIVPFSEGSFHGTVISLQGRRMTMEDSFIAIPSLSFDKESGFFAVFDGHGGSASSSYCASQFLQLVTLQLKDEGIETIPTVEQYQQVLLNSFIRFDSILKERDVGSSGSTAIVGFLTPKYYIIANLGDSRCVLSSGGKGIALSTDHKPYMEKEKERIIKSGSIVVNGRVEGDLAVSRSFGDFMYKKEMLPPEEQAVSCIPDILVHERSEDDNYMVFACDGVWDVYPHLSEFVETVNTVLQSYETTESALDALTNGCIEKGSRDNITLILVLLENPPKPNPEMIQKRRDDSIQVYSV